jgi:hypothetical protein
MRCSDGQLTNDRDLHNPMASGLRCVVARGPQWIARQLTEAFGCSGPLRYIIRDRDGAYGEAFIRRLQPWVYTGSPDFGSIPLAKWPRGEADRRKSSKRVAVGSIDRPVFVRSIARFPRRWTR